MRGVHKFQCKSFVWINVDTPTESSLKKLQKEYNFHPLEIQDCLAHNQRPKIDEYEDHFFIVLHMSKVVANEIIIDEVDIFVCQNYVMTVHEGNPFLNELFHMYTRSPELADQLSEHGSGYFLYKLINEIFANTNKLVEGHIDLAGHLEDQMFERPGKEDMLESILLLRKDLITLRRIVGSQRTVIPQLEHKSAKFLSEKLDVYFADVVDIIERTWNQLEALSALGESLARTNESLITHNINNVMKILTIISVTMLPLTLVTNIYGMNIQLPFSHTPYAFNGIIGVMMGVFLLLLIFFKYKKWL